MVVCNFVCRNAKTNFPISRLKKLANPASRKRPAGPLDTIIMYQEGLNRFNLLYASKLTIEKIAFYFNVLRFIFNFPLENCRQRDIMVKTFDPIYRYEVNQSWSLLR